ncbi:hypothetical protein EDD11_004046 [Mortierella claussenii]|nr:hypothetical protein EDD11_004046 [Mortierella claussenii]
MYKPCITNEMKYCRFLSLPQVLVVLFPRIQYVAKYIIYIIDTIDVSKLDRRMSTHFIVEFESSQNEYGLIIRHPRYCPSRRVPSIWPFSLNILLSLLSAGPTAYNCVYYSKRQHFLGVQVEIRILGPIPILGMVLENMDGVMERTEGVALKNLNDMAINMSRTLSI